MQSDCILITGVNGEIGHGLVTQLKLESSKRIIALDISPLDKMLADCIDQFYMGDILDTKLIDNIFRDNEFSTIYHLASILSTSAERNPEKAHHVNVEGTINLLAESHKQTEVLGSPIKFIYPSSIAVYGLPSADAKQKAGKVKESDYCQPITMYGCNKIYCEIIGSYYSKHYKILSGNGEGPKVDFRGLRFPGLISAITVPTGGTSDYGPEMLHHAAQNKPYDCFVRQDSTLPFMVMPDAIKALLSLSKAPREQLSLNAYNVTSFNPSAQQIYETCLKFFPKAQIHFAPDPARQMIVDSWPQDVDDSSAADDWGWKADYDYQRSFEDYLIPAIMQRYSF